METVRDNPVLNKVFGLFQDYQNTGQFARLLLETRGGYFTAHLSVQSSAPWMESTRQTETTKPRRTTPSRRRRNKARHDQWIAKKKANHDKPDHVQNREESILDNPEDSEVVDKISDSTDKIP